MNVKKKIESLFTRTEVGLDHTHTKKKETRLLYRKMLFNDWALMISLSVDMATSNRWPVGLPPSPCTHRGILDSPEGFFFRQRRCSSVEKKKKNQQQESCIRSSKRDRWSGTCRKRGPVGSISLAAVAHLFHRSFSKVSRLYIIDAHNVDSNRSKTVSFSAPSI